MRLDYVLLLLQCQRQLLDDARVVDVAQAALDEVYAAAETCVEQVQQKLLSLSYIREELEAMKNK